MIWPFKRDPLGKLQKEYEKTMEKAVFFQRNGDLKKYAELTSLAENLLQKIQAEQTKIKD